MSSSPSSFASGRAWTLLVLVSLSLLILAAPALAQQEVLDCEAEQPEPLVPVDLERCEELDPIVKDPSALPLRQYEEAMGEFLRNFCHRNEDAGWKRDKFVRDVGPYTARLEDGAWDGVYTGTHQPVVIWYSEEMLGWMAENRPPEEDEAPSAEDETAVPDGAVMVKEMYPAPGASCRDVEPVSRLLPTSGAAFMVRDSDASHDGWFWGWFGWPASGWEPDYPPGPTNSYPDQGFGQYCLNCHASARKNDTFASLRNVEGEEGEPLVFLSQHFFDAESKTSHHRLVSLPGDEVQRLGTPNQAYDTAFTDGIPATSLDRPSWSSVSKMPSETYDNVFVEAGGPSVKSQFVTSDQCLGCHDAGSTGLQFDMTVPNPNGDNLLNLSPYGTWRTSPMGLGGRDPIFFAQLASETQTFHPEIATVVQDTCLGCHGILGQRQFALDHQEPEKETCAPFTRDLVNSVPYPADPKKNPHVETANFGALARDGISCTACHHMAVGQGPESAVAKEEQNFCVVEQRIPFLNPQNHGFAATFTGSFLVGQPDELYGPFEDPKTKPMEHALGIEPVFDGAVQNSALCGTCHTVHLPVYRGEERLGFTYEQTTYPEWAFSAYRTGLIPTAAPPAEGESTPASDLLPGGAGKLAESCQSCHMPSADADGKPFRSKIASIQEYSNFPQAEYNLGPDDLDLEVRENFARHTLVGLNVFFIKMAQQFPDVLGIRTTDPMLVSRGLDPLLFSEQAMLEQASNDTAEVALENVSITDDEIRATVEIKSHVGHKFPSGVGFRRAFVEFQVLDDLGQTLWSSGRTNGAGVLVDPEGQPLPGELWWTDDCSERLNPGDPVYQPHHQTITMQTQVQIYQELVTSPAPVEDPKCGEHAVAGGNLTTSFLSICGHEKDNRILPTGYLPVKQRIEIAKALGAQKDLATDSGSVGTGGDPDYTCAEHGKGSDAGSDTACGGGDSLDYVVSRRELDGRRPASVRATLYYQSIPPYYLQDRFCTAEGDDTERLYFLAGHLNLRGTEAADWKFELVSASAQLEGTPPLTAADSTRTRGTTATGGRRSLD